MSTLFENRCKVSNYRRIAAEQRFGGEVKVVCQLFGISLFKCLSNVLAILRPTQSIRGSGLESHRVVRLRSHPLNLLNNS